MSTDAAADETPEQFFARHVAGGPTHVVAAFAERAIDGCDFAVFSSLALAQAWADGLDDADYDGVVFVPYVIDVPEFGNVPREMQQ